MMSRQEHGPRHFATTRWSLVRQLGAPHQPDARSALIELCRRYGYPVYAYVRHCGHAPLTAQVITRSFLQHLFQQFRDDDEAPANGMFRRYLLNRLNAFLAEHWHTDTAQDLPPELAIGDVDFEQRNRVDNTAARSPEQAYQQSFAREVVARGLARLCEEARVTGHLDMYEALMPFLARDPAAGEYEELARGLNRRALGLVVALKQLRHRFRQLIAEELADTVDSPADLAAERRELYDVLRPRQ
jgi:RNA polymerase sigma-70 factor (ECF subfamily)